MGHVTFMNLVIEGSSAESKELSMNRISLQQQISGFHDSFTGGGGGTVVPLNIPLI